MNFSTFSMTKGGSTATLVPPLPQPTTAGQSFNSFSNCGDHVEELPVPDFLAIGALSEISKLTCGKECVCLQRWAADHPEMFLDYSSRRNNFLTSTDSQSKRTEVSSARSTDGMSETAPLPIMDPCRCAKPAARFSKVPSTTLSLVDQRLPPLPPPPPPPPLPLNERRMWKARRRRRRKPNLWRSPWKWRRE